VNLHIKQVYIHTFWYVSSPLPTKSYKSGRREYIFSQLTWRQPIGSWCKKTIGYKYLIRLVLAWAGSTYNLWWLLLWYSFWGLWNLFDMYNYTLFFLTVTRSQESSCNCFSQDWVQQGWYPSLEVTIYTIVVYSQATTIR
jgi:hypothetical protein